MSIQFQNQNKIRVLITGGNGDIAQKLSELLDYAIYETHLPQKNELDVRSKSSVEEYFPQPLALQHLPMSGPYGQPHLQWQFGSCELLRSGFLLRIKSESIFAAIIAEAPAHSTPLPCCLARRYLVFPHYLSFSTLS